MLLGISGRLRSGKDTAARPLLDAGWHHGSFARALKQFMYNLNPVVPGPPEGSGRYYRLAPLVDAYGWEKAKDDFPEVRALLQRCGTDAGRRVLGDDVWVNAAMAAVPDGVSAVFTDVRFPNEARAIQRAGGAVIRIERPALGPVPPGAHVSETALDGYGFDAVIVNDGTVDDLHRKVSLTVATFEQLAAEAAG